MLSGEEKVHAPPLTGSPGYRCRGFIAQSTASTRYSFFSSAVAVEAGFAALVAVLLAEVFLAGSFFAGLAAFISSVFAALLAFAHRFF